jgi:hypothetical protein
MDRVNGGITGIATAWHSMRSCLAEGAWLCGRMPRDAMLGELLYRSSNCRRYDDAARPALSAGERKTRPVRPVGAALARCPRQRKAKQRSADHEDDNDNHPPAQHHCGRLMLWHSDIGDLGAHLVEQTATFCAGRGHAGRAFGFRPMRMSRPVRTAPATGPGTVRNNSSTGSAIRGVTAATTCRIRSTSPPAHSGSLSAR